MRRIGLIVSALLFVGSLLVASNAQACPARASAEPSKADVIRGAKKGLIFTPSQATKQGKRDDRLIRPRRTYDASAGMVG